ncbi:hypothetical protein JHK82_012932 [Glycine max]|nr:hypothetical protein JHK85_013293 [Glycine max]KAG5057956.1 hypothetical protein JHK86_012952 [Glycine max]KAG5154963.1 hypothetical protein JHK82_012932 [Glycine max]
MTVSSTAPKPSLTSSNSITLSSSPSSSYKPPPSPSLSPPHSSTPSPLFARNTLIRAFAATPTPHHSLTLFRLLQTSPLNPYDFTYPFSLKAYARYSSVTIGESLHSLTLKTGVFDEMTDRDVVSWSSMIAAYVACNSPLDAFHMFREMGMENEEPNSVTLVSLLSACTKMLNLSAVEMDVALGTALFEMYAKCGEIDKAFLVFNSMGDRNLQSCTIMISALANHGREKDVISLFNQMEDMGLRPDSLSFAPSVEHYGCMVYLLGRAGLIKEAYDIIKGMPMEPNDVILRSFLSACRNQGCASSLDDDFLSKLESVLGANYVLTGNVFSTCASWNWKDANDLRVVMKQKGLKKIPGCSWVRSEVQS